MKRVFFAIPLLAFALSSCKDSNENVAAEITFEFSSELKDNSADVKVVPSDLEQSYVTGALSDDEYAELGGTPEAVAAYIDKALSSDDMVISTGETVSEYNDLLWQTEYVLYAAPVKDGAVVSTPSLGSFKVFRDSVEVFVDSNIPPTSMSDNGRYIVGDYDKNSYLYDVRRDVIDSESYVGAELNDVSDNGIAAGSYYGKPGYFQDGVFNEIPLISGAMSGTVTGVNPEGTRFAGYCEMEDGTFAPFIYENGSVSVLEFPEDNIGEKPVVSAAKGMGANGNVVGYIASSEYLELGCYWHADNGYDLFVKDEMVKDEETGSWNKIIGGLLTYISPSGRYIASMWTEMVDGFPGEDYPYVYDTETGEFKMFDTAAFVGYRVDYVGNDGEIYLSDAKLGFSSMPFVAVYGNQAPVTYKEYAKSKYGVEIEDYAGSAMSVSADGKTVLCGRVDFNSGTYIATIHFLREE